MNSVSELLQALIRIPSVNPDGDPGTDCVGEAKCAQFVAEFLTESGAEVELREVLPGRPNVVGRFPGASEGMPRILFAPHTDTVSVSGMTIAPLGGELRDGKIWGRGASDTKGSMAAMLWALREERELLKKLPYEIWFAGLVGEEAGQHGSKALAGEEHFDFVVVGEPTLLQTVYTHKGSAWITLRTTGRAVHASMPENGENALYKMAELLICIRDEIAPELRTNVDPVLGSSTISAGTITGGSKVNIVPDFCEVRVDMRTIPGQRIAPVFKTLRERVPDVEIRVVESSPLLTDAAHPLIQKLGECGAALAGAPWFCDAAVFAEAGMPSVAIGPGSIVQAHTADEFIEVAELERGAEFFQNFLWSLINE